MNHGCGFHGFGVWAACRLGVYGAIILDHIHDYEIGSKEPDIELNMNAIHGSDYPFMSDDEFSATIMQLARNGYLTVKPERYGFARYHVTKKGVQALAGFDE